MSDRPGWKQSLHEALQEPHAIGWIGLFVLVIIIGIGALYFTSPRLHSAAPASVSSHATR